MTNGFACGCSEARHTPDERTVSIEENLSIVSDTESKLLHGVFKGAAKIMNSRAVVYVRTDRRKSPYETTVDVLRAVFPQKHLRRRARPLGGPSQTRLFGGYEPSDGEVDLILTPKLRRS
jgi:hypothetical protein